MTDVDRVPFSQAFNRLAVASRLPADEGDAAMKQIYFDGLADLPVAAVAAAAEHLAKTAEWFPKVSEWRTSAKVQKANLRLVLLPAREEPWKEECEVCFDSGWERKTCYPGTPVNCGRKYCIKPRSERPEHFYVMRCACVPTNRTYQRHHVYNTYEQAQ